MAPEETNGTNGTVTVDPAHYRQAMAHFATGVAVVTSRDLEGERHGMTANAVTSVSLSPVLLLVCIANHLPTHRAVRETGRFNINLLRAAQRDLAQQFAHPAADKFDGVRLRPECEVPVLADALAHFECSVHQQVAAGDHSIFIGRVEACGGHEAAATDPLLYFRSDFHELPGGAEVRGPVASAGAR
jgi:3-hydroxy-9,10-secoandrosta-1,3,5(10)-triene-9,17-dione monooxygenase reductase component